jgi:site-specific recombinase XerD
MRNHIVSAAQRAGITKHLNWHVFRHTFATLLAANGEDVKTVQSLLRHANPGITMGIYAHAVSSRKREAQSRVVEMVLPSGRKSPFAIAVGGTA